MRKLLLVKHAMPVVDSGAPPATWPLSDEGRAACIPLARAIAPYEPVAIFSSDEPKALETAQIVGARMRRPVAPHSGLGEQRRPRYEVVDDFTRTVHEAMQRPEELILGDETAAAARERFSNAVTEVARDVPEGNIVIVAHGVVIAMFIACLIDADPVPIWDSLGLPALAVVTYPEAMRIEYQQSFDAQPLP